MNIVTKRQLAILAQATALSLNSQFIFVCFLNGKKQKPKEKTSNKLFVLFKLQLLLVLLVIPTQSILVKKIFFGAEIQDIYCVRQRTSSGESSLFIAILGDAPA